MNVQDDVIVHLTELRKRLLIVIGAFIIALCLGLYAAPDILRYLKARPLPAPVIWNVFSFTDGLFVYMRCAFLFALLFTLPVILYQTWAFVRPGLTEEEAKGTLVFVPVSFLLFVVGVSFSYFVVFPMMIRFLTTMNQSIGAVETYGIDKYFSFLFNLMLPLGLAFEMPVAALFLTKLGLLTPARLRMTRKYAYVGLAVIGTCISPPDFVSHLSVTVPLIALFEISVLAAGWYARRAALREAVS